MNESIGNPEIFTIGGTRIVINPLLTEAGEPFERVRTWKERLFTRPWLPFKKTQTVVPQVPLKTAFKLPKGSLAMHPVLANELRTMIKKDY